MTILIGQVKDFLGLTYESGIRPVETIEKIEANISNYEYEGGSDVIKVYIHHLRRKIDDGFSKKLLYTVKNTGYVIRDDKE